MTSGEKMIWAAAFSAMVDPNAKTVDFDTPEGFSAEKELELSANSAEYAWEAVKLARGCVVGLIEKLGGGSDAVRAMEQMLMD